MYWTDFWKKNKVLQTAQNNILNNINNMNNILNNINNMNNILNNINNMNNILRSS